MMDICAIEISIIIIIMRIVWAVFLLTNAQKGKSTNSKWNNYSILSGRKQLMNYLIIFNKRLFNDKKKRKNMITILFSNVIDT